MKNISHLYDFFYVNDNQLHLISVYPINYSLQKLFFQRYYLLLGPLFFHYPFFEFFFLLNALLKMNINIYKHLYFFHLEVMLNGYLFLQHVLLLDPFLSYSNMVLLNGLVLHFLMICLHYLIVLSSLLLLKNLLNSHYLFLFLYNVLYLVLL